MRINGTGGRYCSVEEVAQSVLPICALGKKASMGATYVADPFWFDRSLRTEDLRDRAVEKLTVGCY